MPKYFTKKEVALHQKADDAWLIVSGKIYDLSGVIKKYGPDAEESKPLVMFAGKDVSHWFENDAGEYVSYVDIESGEKIPFSLHGVPPHVVDAPQICWWRDDALLVGELTRKSRLVKIVNTIIDKSTIIECCSEDTFQKVKARYAAPGFSISDDCYTWTSFATGSELNPELTLDENGMSDESGEFEQLCMPTNYHIPSILLFYKDVITPPLPLTLQPGQDLAFDIQ